MFKNAYVGRSVRAFRYFGVGKPRARCSARCERRKRAEEIRLLADLFSEEKHQTNNA
jgi:hypothetical protein